MNSLRIRVGELKPDHGAGHDFPFAVQVSDCGLVWWTIGRFKTFDAALAVGKDLERFVKANQIVSMKHIMWEAKV